MIVSCKRPILILGLPRLTRTTYKRVSGCKHFIEKFTYEYVTSLSFDFYPTAVYFVLSSGFHCPPLLSFETDRQDLRGLDLGKNYVIKELL